MEKSLEKPFEEWLRSLVPFSLEKRTYIPLIEKKTVTYKQLNIYY